MTSKKKSVFLSAVFLSGLFLLLSGCARYPDLTPGLVKDIPRSGSPLAPQSAVVEEKIETVPTLQEQPPPSDYVVGPNDVILVTVSGHPEFSVQVRASGEIVRGSRVDGTGHIQLPILGLVHVAGMTLPQIRSHIQGLLMQYLQEPSVVVEVLNYQSQPLYLLGQFKNTGTFYMDRPLNLLQGISLGGGYGPTADLRSAHVVRDRRILPVDVYELLTKADQTQNIWLKPGDTIFIPDQKERAVLIFGAVKNSGQFPIPAKGLDLLQAMALAQLPETGYNIRKVYIIRTLSTTRGQLMVIDFDKILRGDAPPIALQDRDVLFVPKSPIQNWNEAISQMLPSFQAIGAILSPFVQMKYLFRD